MKITKMHGLGNDFILAEGVREEDAGSLARVLCERHTSVGADGFVNVLPSDTADIRMQILNADGSEAEMCGNGIRCFARYVYDKGLVRGASMSVETKAGIMRPELLLEDGAVEAVRVNMGRAGTGPEDVPVRTSNPVRFEIQDTDGRPIELSAIRMGVPHAVVFLSEPMPESRIAALGRYIETHPVFPQKTNVNFVEVLEGDRLRVSTWERGAGRTLACGTGSCASAVLANRLGRTGTSVTVELQAGTLQIDIAEDGTVYMTGPAEYVFEGETFRPERRSSSRT